jgi:nitronate monooxygenase
LVKENYFVGCVFSRPSTGVLARVNVLSMPSLREILGIEIPIIQAPMAGAQDSALAIAVSNAGALGSLPAAMLSPEALRAELAAIRAQTSRPFNVNFFCHDAPAPNAEREGRWRALLAPYYVELGVDANAAASGPSRAPFGEAAAAVLEAIAPPVVSFHFGLPSVELLRRVRALGAKILSSATTVEEARWLEARGVDVIVAQGLEAGGHRGTFLSGDLATQPPAMRLLADVLQAVRVPVVVAGGIASAGAVRAAIDMGAAGVQIGTAYLLCPEARTSPIHRALLKSQRAHETAVTNLFTGRPARGIVNRLMRELGPMHPLTPEFPLAAAAIAPLRAKAEAGGSGDFSPLWCGGDPSGAREVPAGVLTRALAAELVAPADATP